MNEINFTKEDDDQTDEETNDQKTAPSTDHG